MGFLSLLYLSGEGCIVQIKPFLLFFLSHGRRRYLDTSVKQPE